MIASDTPPASPGTARGPWLTLIVLSLAQFIVLLDVTIVNVALPSIQSDLHFSTEGLQWVISAYTLVFGGFLLLGGRAADLAGRRRVFVIGLGLFGLTSLLAGLSVSPGMLVALRAAQGLGAAMLSPAAFSLLQVTFAHGRERNVAMGIWGGLAGLGGTLGAVLGGVIVDAISWRWVFLVNVPVVIVLVIAAFPIITESKAVMARRTLDVAGALLGTAGLLAVMLAVIQADTWGWGSWEVILLFAAGAALLAAFIAVERRSPAPLVPLHLFRSRNLTFGTGSLALNGAVFLTMFFLTVVFLQQGRGLSALTTALYVLPMGVAAIVGAVISAQLATKVGTRPVQLAGAVFSVAGALLLSRAGLTGSYPATILPGMLVFGAGITATGVTAQIAAVAKVPHNESGTASGVIQAGNQIGGALGLAVITTLATARATAAVTAGHTPQAGVLASFRFGLMAVAVVAAVNLLLTLASPRVTASAARAVEEEELRGVAEPEAQPRVGAGDPPSRQ